MQWKMKYRQALYVNTDDIHMYDVWKDDVSISQLINKGDAWKDEYRDNRCASILIMYQQKIWTNASIATDDVYVVMRDT